MTVRLVLIVGAGPTGLVLALWLTRLGVKVRIIDKTAEPGTTSRAVAVRGGDRLPWVETEPGKDNFAPLASLTWQAHVYGEPRGGLAEVCAELQLPLHVFSWRPGMRRPGLLRGALYLVRPDSHVALADPHADPERLREYLRAGTGARVVTPGERLTEQRHGQPGAGADPARAR